MRHVELAERRLRNAAVRTRLALVSSPSVLDRERALVEAATADRILFVCLGNICRSPMAERYARDRLSEARANVEVGSAGFVEREGRQSPEDAIEAAAAHDVDLSDHRSRLLTSEMLAGSDVVFVMDVRNYRDLARSFGPIEAGVFFLGSLLDRDGHFEIPDPQGRGHEAFVRAYDDVAAAVDELVGSIVGGNATSTPAPRRRDGL